MMWSCDLGTWGSRGYSSRCYHTVFRWRSCDLMIVCDDLVLLWWSYDLMWRSCDLMIVCVDLVILWSWCCDLDTWCSRGYSSRCYDCISVTILWSYDLMWWSCDLMMILCDDLVIFFWSFCFCERDLVIFFWSFCFCEGPNKTVRL
jgi:hypothetical protein